MGGNSHLYFFRFFYVIIFENSNDTSSKDFDQYNQVISVQTEIFWWKKLICKYFPGFNHEKSFNMENFYTNSKHSTYFYLFIYEIIYMCVFLVGIYLLTSICVWGGQILENGLVPKITLFLCFNFYEKN